MAHFFPGYCGQPCINANWCNQCARSKWKGPPWCLSGPGKESVWWQTLVLVIVGTLIISSTPKELLDVLLSWGHTSSCWSCNTLFSPLAGGTEVYYSNMEAAVTARNPAVYLLWPALLCLSLRPLYVPLPKASKTYRENICPLYDMSFWNRCNK